MTRFSALVQTFYCNSRGADGGICNNSYEDTGTSHEVWKAARETGWKPHHSGHLCPRHSTREGNQ